MTKRIFKSIFLASLLALLISFLLIFGVLYGYTTNVLKGQLSEELKLAARGVENDGLDYFTGLDSDNVRITWINADGSVLFDSRDPDTAAMENHLERQEVKDALRTGSGESERYSSTMMQRYIYVATRLTDGSVLRVSAAQNSVWGLILGMLQPFIVVLILVTIFSAIIARRMSEKIVRPINTLDLDHPLENTAYDELSPLFRRIHLQQLKLTEQKKILAQRQDELDIILGNMQEGMALLKNDGSILSMNTAAQEILKINAFYPGQNMLELCRNLDVAELLKEAFGGRKAERMLLLDGKIYQAQANPVFETEAEASGGEPDASENIPSDRMKASAVSGSGSVRGATLVLFDVTKQQQADQMRREFTANVSHELKTPLHSISGYAELMKDGIVKPEDIESFAGKIYKEAQRTIRMVEDIINLSHLDEGAEDLPWEKTDVGALARDVCERLKPSAEDKKVKLALQCESAVMDAKPALVEEIIYNLCDNAIKYNVAGGKVNLSVYRHDGQVVISVADTGVGIPKEDQKRIFERFYRVDKSRSRELGGTGLGLSIVKHAVKILNGKIEINSNPGEGTLIRVRLPETRTE